MALIDLGICGLAAGGYVHADCDADFNYAASVFGVEVGQTADDELAGKSSRIRSHLQVNTDAGEVCKRSVVSVQFDNAIRDADR